LDQQLRQFGRRFEPDLADAHAGRAYKGRGQRVTPPRLFHLPDGQHAAHWFTARLSLPTFCAPSAVVTRMSLPSTTTTTPLRPITETCGPSLSTSTFSQSTSST